MRCGALAQALRRARVNPLVLAKSFDGLASGLLKSLGVAVEAVDNEFDEEGDAANTLAVARERGARQVVIDNYALGEPYRNALRRGGLRVTVVDDLAEAEQISCDCILNQNMGAASLLSRYREIAPTAKGYLLGQEYVLLREDLLERGDQVRRERSKGSGSVMCAERRPTLLVAMGGSDVYDLTPRIVARVSPLAELWEEIVVVCGPGMSDPTEEAVRRAAALAPRFEVFRSPNLADLYARCDVAITAGGSMTHELTYFGVGMVLIQVAENQRVICEGFKSRGLAAVHAVDDLETPGFVESVQSLSLDKEELVDLRHRLMEAVDGRGGARVARAITQGE